MHVCWLEWTSGGSDISVGRVRWDSASEEWRCGGGDVLAKGWHVWRPCGKKNLKTELKSLWKCDQSLMKRGGRTGGGHRGLPAGWGTAVVWVLQATGWEQVAAWHAVLQQRRTGGALCRAGWQLGCEGYARRQDDSQISSQSHCLVLFSVMGKT